MAQTGPVIQVEKVTHDFGQIPQGLPVKFSFTILNIGDSPLVIQDVQKVCGCTVTDWTKSPIAPGGRGTVSAQYNAIKEGQFRKPVTVISNAANGPLKLFLTGEVMTHAALQGGEEE